jgi:hypothetical protein
MRSKINRLIRCLCVALIIFSLSACDPFRVFRLFGGCREDAIIGGISPNGHYAATVYKRTCGATTGWDTYILIEPDSSRDRKNVVFGIAGLYAIAVTWTDNTHLRVECIRCKKDNIFKQEHVWRDVEISYVSYGDDLSSTSAAQ